MKVKKLHRDSQETRDIMSDYPQFGNPNDWPETFWAVMTDSGDIHIDEYPDAYYTYKPTRERMLQLEVHYENVS